MEVVRNVARMRHLSHRLQGERKQIGLVPTWGGLHDGHLALVRRANELADVSVVSVLSNPADSTSEAGQTSHSIELTQDVELLVPTGVDYVFAPKMQEFRHPDASTEVIVRGLTERLFGGLRPRFYTEASTLLVTLFHVTNPDVVCLGRKDPQLVAITNQLVADLQFSCQVSVAPIVREPDGVAASWWLPRLTPRERQAASLLYKALEKAQVLFGAGERTVQDLVTAMREVLSSDPLIQIDYIGLVDTETLEPVASVEETAALAALAVTINEARLIDSSVLNE